jgi:hypothetical protein
MTRDHRPLVPAVMAAGHGISRAMGARIDGANDLIRSTASIE